MDYTILGIDQGNGNVKTRGCVFPCGFKKQETKPSELFTKDILAYKGSYYSLTPNRFSYEIDKTQNENCLILTLFAIAKELKERAMMGKPEFDWKRDFRGFVGKEIVLSIGLPPAHFEKLRDPFKKYFLDAARYGLDFKYNEKSFSFHIKEVFVFPQNYAAVMIFKPGLIKKYSTVHCIDIGDGTVDLMTLKNGMPDKDTMLSRELGMSRLREQIIDDVINDYNMTLDGTIIEDILTPGREVIAPEEIKQRIRQETAQWAGKIVDQLHTKVPDFRFAPTVFLGGGSKLLAPFLEATGMFGVKGEIIGEALWEKYHKWPMFSKFFDNQGPLPHHIHHRDEHAKRVGADGKAEMYFFPSQCNNHGGEFPFTFFGLNPDTTKEEMKETLMNFAKGDNKLLDLSRAYKITLDTGWDVPPGVLHAPASLCTYEPQFASDVYAMYQSVLYGGHCVSEDLLWKNCPEEEKGNYDYLMDVIDWEANVDPDFHKNRFMAPKVI